MSGLVIESLHTQLVGLAAKWLQHQGCSLVITDMSHGGSETPDGLGWKGTSTTLVECKASRSDFLADRQKGFRLYPERGMGNYRYFLAPSGIIRAEELPEKWGLLELTADKIRKTQPAQHQEKSHHDEASILLSAIRRLGPLSPPGMSVRFYTFDSKQRATLGLLIDEADPVRVNASAD